MYPYGSYMQNDSELVDSNTKTVHSLWTVNGSIENGRTKNVREREYSYDEAIDLAGTGWYTTGLLMTLSLTLVSMCMDIFSFSTVVALSSCDLYLTPAQTQILLSVPFLGPILMAYTWGYISDTRGRRRSLIVATSVSFVMSVLCAFSPNWIVLAVLKFISTCFCSCAQSVTYALLGESCAERFKGTYLLAMSSVMHLSMPAYFVVSYFIGYFEFEVNLGFIVFVPWRLLVILLALPLGLSALFLSFFYESPKFLLNAGREDQALEVLKKICRRNRGGLYPVKNVVLDEMGNLTQKSESFVASLWQQTAPLFKLPLLPKTVLLYCLIFIMYSTSSSLFVWLPFLANDFTMAVNSMAEQHEGLCSVIGFGHETEASELVECSSNIDLPIVIFTVSVGSTYCILNFFMSKLANRKKIIMIIIFTFSSACCLAALHIPNNLVSIISYFGVVSNSLCMGIVFAYCVDLYPTSFRGMVSCLGVMVARISSIFGVNFVVTIITWQCSSAFYALCGLIFSGAVLSCFLPSDRIKKV